MSKRETYETRTEELLLPITRSFGVEVYDVEYVKEGSDWYLRAYIDKEEGVNIVDCENVSRALSEELDRTDFIADAYILEVSSPGLGRTLKKEKHFLKSLGKEVELRTYRPIERCKEFVGILQEYQDGNVTLEIEGSSRIFEKADIALVKLTFDF
ncbi:MAG: ribosome maturation factor RimP [Lachnospiraceae bacterium]|nr:ribosome maturation factor RimP [Lachnospiraceae bacterium]